MNLQTYPDSELMMMDVANVVAGQLNAHLLRHDTAMLAVGGGTTPGPIFDALCAADLDWDRVTVVPTDERWIGEESERSNARLIRERLLVDRAAQATFLSLYRPVAAPEEALDDINAALAPHLPVTVLLLGMGTDMHTASLFPGGEGLEAALKSDAPPAAVIRAEAAGEPRITLTAPVLADVMATHLVITGAAKREALERAAKHPPEEAPIRVVWADLKAHWAE